MSDLGASSLPRDERGRSAATEQQPASAGASNTGHLAAFSSGDAVTVELRGAGYMTTEDATILEVKDGIAWVDNGPGNDPDPYDAATGKYARDSFGGFSRRIVRAAS